MANPIKPAAVSAKSATSAAPRFDYPSKLGSGGQPYVLFTRQRPVYDERAVGINPISFVAMYIPMNFNVADSAQYDNVATGALGALTANILDNDKSLGDLMPSDFNLDNPDVAATVVKGTPALTSAATSALGAVFAKVGGAGVGAVVGGVAGGTVVQQEVSRKMKAVLNPRQFGLFKAPNMRNFSFDFRFIPENAGESETVKNIIKEFRTAMYPELTHTGLAYSFPDAYKIKFENVGEGMIKLPEVVCTNATVTYNPNAMSYFTMNKNPVEINLSLQFQELQPIHRKMIEEGY